MATHIKNILEKIGSTEPKIEQAMKFQKVLNIWDKVLDKKIICEAKPENLKNFILYVLVTSPVLANELSLKKKEILENIKSMTNDDFLSDIKFRVGGLGKEDKEEKGKKYEEKKCKICGVKFLGEKDLCPVCKIKNDEKKDKRIREIIEEDINIEFSKARSKISNLKEREFFRIKKEIISNFIEKIRMLAREAKEGKTEGITKKLKEEMKFFISRFGERGFGILKEHLSYDLFKIVKNQK